MVSGKSRRVISGIWMGVACYLRELSMLVAVPVSEWQVNERKLKTIWIQKKISNVSVVSKYNCSWLVKDYASVSWNGYLYSGLMREYDAHLKTRNAMVMDDNEVIEWLDAGWKMLFGMIVGSTWEYAVVDTKIWNRVVESPDVWYAHECDDLLFLLIELRFGSLTRLCLCTP